MRFFATDRIEYCNGIVAHVSQRVVNTIELARQTDVAIVESDNLETFVAKELTPLHRIVDAL
jgi:hypothetical protein